jgi:hypothetical protein
METLVLWARATPLTEAANGSLPGLLAGLPRAEVGDERAVAWFAGGSW